MPTTVMILRHAEKPLGDGPPHGVTIDGIPNAESLTPRGWQRAGALVGLFVPVPGDESNPRLPTPTHLFASQVGAQSSSRRPRETLVPLGERLGIAVDSRFRKEEVGHLAAAVLAIEGVVLVAWEHHLIPSIADLLMGDATSVPRTWPDDRYDMIWVFEDTGPGRRREFREVPESLLAGDDLGPIASPRG